MERLDYISIIAGGKCKFNCSFCIGNDIRENNHPNISNKYISFIECYGDMTDEISISGSTSDPYFIELDVHFTIKNRSRDFDLKTSLHTRNTKLTNKMMKLIEWYDELVLGIDETFNPDNFKFQNNKSIRFSIVITKENQHKFNREWLDNISNKTGVNSFTFRPNVFEEFNDGFNTFMTNMKLLFPEERKYAYWFNYKDSYITYWDNKEFSQNVRYLWNDGNITEDDEWKKLFK